MYDISPAGIIKNGKKWDILNLGFKERTKNTPINRVAEAKPPKSEARTILFLYIR